MEQQALFTQQFAIAKLGSEVREKSSVSEAPRSKIRKEEKRNLWEWYQRSKTKKTVYRKRMHGIWKQEGMKEVRERQLCDQRRNIRAKESYRQLQTDVETVDKYIPRSNVWTFEMPLIIAK